MILDSSAVVAWIIDEPGRTALAEPLDAAGSVAIGAPTLVETEIVLVRRLGLEARAHLAGFLRVNDVSVVPFGEDHWRQAVTAFLRFGKGRHPANLNFGDCMAYATARLAGEPLLALGDDFALTDVELAR